LIHKIVRLFDVKAFLQNYQINLEGIQETQFLAYSSLMIKRFTVSQYFMVIEFVSLRDNC